MFMATASSRDPLTLMNINEVSPGMMEGGTYQVSHRELQAQPRNFGVRWEMSFLSTGTRIAKP